MNSGLGTTLTEDMQEAILTLPERVWEPACDAGGQARAGARAAELTGLLDLPAGMRVIVCLAHRTARPGQAQLRASQPRARQAVRRSLAFSLL